MLFRSSSPQGKILIFEDPAVIDRKIKRAVTDTDNDVRYDVKNKPGIANLLQILAAIVEETPQNLAANYSSYGDLKKDVAAAVVENLRPLSERYHQFLGDLGELSRLLRLGSDYASAVAAPVYDRASAAMGLVSL